MHYTVLSFIFSLLWTFVVSIQCKTIFGMDSKCVSLSDCPEMLKAYHFLPILDNIANYIEASYCPRTQQGIPGVCCGPLPTPKIFSPVVQEDETIAKDSFLAPRYQCRVDKESDRIHAGDFIGLDKYPWMALLGYLNNIILKVTYQCGGMLLNNRYVLTAAHCLIGPIIEEHGEILTVRLGEYDTLTDIDCVGGMCADLPQEIPVLSAYVHERHSRKYLSLNDIGLIRLARRATYTYFVQPVCLAESVIDWFQDKYFDVVRWSFRDESSPVIIKMQMYLKSNQYVCHSMGKNSKMAMPTDEQICVNGLFLPNSCNSDPGGTLMARSPEGIWEAVGIMAWTDSGCGDDKPVFYTSIAHYLEWIQSTMVSTNL